MTNKELEEYIPFIFQQMEGVLKGKNHDYTGGEDAFANFKQAEDFGIDPLVGLCVRMGDKMKRVQTYCKKGELQVRHEGIEDAFKDFIGYSVLALAMLSERSYP
tara:strand:+ start:72 stop:383 length:312 start_codon:yes stop_codon:yes gene_type:complete